MGTHEFKPNFLWLHKAISSLTFADSFELFLFLQIFIKIFKNLHKLSIKIMKLDAKKGSGEYQIPEIGFFEGTEKLLEVWFHHDKQGSYDSGKKDHTHEIKNDLREIPR